MEEEQPATTSRMSDLSEKQCKFTSFSSLPAEIRQEIWEMFMDALEDKSELFIHEPSQFLGTPKLTTPTVYTGFPALLHANAEARAIAQKRVTCINAAGAQCMVPVRPFRPDLDVLYIPWEALRSFFLLREVHYGGAWLSQVQHVAVDICVSTNLPAFFRHLEHLPSLRTLRFLVSSERKPLKPRSMLIISSPVPRCALRIASATESSGDCLDDSEAVDKGEPSLMVRPQGLLQRPEEATRGATWSGSLSAYLTHIRRHFLRQRDLGVVWPDRRCFAEYALRFITEVNILTRYRYSPEGSSFVEFGEDNVADLVLV
ncbi:hypothetical protein RRF57_011522 [Xylaria bambusicola]|uniref:2EXR domain-containing protein n=1 Tax=Xylaria bambusicola TaxID=326684 RepID=A0AAN7Z3S2_9PEZI